jgi:beta-aspartyl-dipeptidase (metallo-type)
VYLYDPEEKGRKDLLIANGRLVSIGSEITPFPLPDEEIEVIDSEIQHTRGALLAVPGFFDGHVHLIGGGGEGGFGTRTPEGNATMFFDTGTTSVLGVLGTDSITRDLKSLYGKVMQLKSEGLNAYMMTGSYRFPPKTMTGDVMQDIVLVKEILGFGEIAVSDHRGSGIAGFELKRLGLDCRVGGMVSGKAGKVIIHMGDGSEGLKILREATDDNTLPAYQLLPTHISRNEQVLKEGIAWIEAKAGNIDFTAGEETDTYLYHYTSDRYWPHISVSSDGLGSFPLFNENRECIGVGIAPVTGLFSVFKKLVSERNVPLAQALLPFTKTPARFFGLEKEGVGCVKKGGRADLLILDEDCSLLMTICEGRVRYRAPNFRLIP